MIFLLRSRINASDPLKHIVLFHSYRQQLEGSEKATRKDQDLYETLLILLGWTEEVSEASLDRPFEFLQSPKYLPRYKVIILTRISPTILDLIQFCLPEIVALGH